MRATSSNDEEWSAHWQCYPFFCVAIEMIAKGQRGTRSHSNMSFLQCAANGLVSFEAVTEKILVRPLIFCDIALEDSQDLRGTSKNLYIDRALKSINCNNRKAESFKKLNNKFFVRSTLFGKFLCRRCTTTTWNFLMRPCLEEVKINTRWSLERLST